MLAWMGNPVEGVHIGTNFGTPWMEGEGTSNVSMKFENGALGYHFGTWGAKGTKLKYSFHAHCTDGMLEADLKRGLLILHRGAREEEKGGESRAGGIQRLPAPGMQGNRAGALHPEAPASKKRGRGPSHGEDNRSGELLRQVWLQEDNGAACQGGLEGKPQAGGEDMEA